MWEMAFVAIMFGIIILNIGYCIFDNEQ